AAGRQSEAGAGAPLQLRDRSPAQAGDSELPPRGLRRNSPGAAAARRRRDRALLVRRLHAARLPRLPGEFLRLERRLLSAGCRVPPYGRSDGAGHRIATAPRNAAPGLGPLAAPALIQRLSLAAA